MYVCMYVCMEVEHLCWNFIRHLWTNILLICGLSEIYLFTALNYFCTFKYNTSVRRYLVHKHVFNQTDSDSLSLYNSTFLLYVQGGIKLPVYIIHDTLHAYRWMASKRKMRSDVSLSSLIIIAFCGRGKSRTS